VICDTARAFRVSPRGSRLVAAILTLVSAAACSPPEPAFTLRFMIVTDAVARDTRTDLEWTRADGGRSLPWTAAEDHCRSLVLAGRGGWRLPEIAELEALYDETQRQPCGVSRDCRLDLAIDLTDPYVWSATERGAGTRFYIDFQFGTTFSPGIPPRLVRRVLCVRAALDEHAEGEQR